MRVAVYRAGTARCAAEPATPHLLCDRMMRQHGTQNFKDWVAHFVKRFSKRLSRSHLSFGEALRLLPRLVLSSNTFIILIIAAVRMLNHSQFRAASCSRHLHPSSPPCIPHECLVVPRNALHNWEGGIQEHRSAPRARCSSNKRSLADLDGPKEAHGSPREHNARAPTGQLRQQQAVSSQNRVAQPLVQPAGMGKRESALQRALSYPYAR